MQLERCAVQFEPVTGKEPFDWAKPPDWAIYSARWFARQWGWWARGLRCAAGLPVKYLELGIWAGTSAAWMLENVLTHPDAQYVGVDAWDLYPHSRYTTEGKQWVEGQARANLAKWSDKVVIYKGLTRDVLPCLVEGQEQFDIAYIDAGHYYAEVMADLAAVWSLVKPGGLIICDDYRGHFDSVHRAVDEFLEARPDQWRKIWNVNQLAFTKEE